MPRTSRFKNYTGSIEDGPADPVEPPEGVDPEHEEEPMFDTLEERDGKR